VIVYLAMVVPDHEVSQIIGVYSTLELAQARFDDAGKWDFNEKWRQYWQRQFSGLSYSDNEIHMIELDKP
jgi:hypothetical protein